MERLACFAHRLQCCVRVLDKSTFAGNGRIRAFKLIGSVAHSSLATGMLIKESGKKLLTACPTRWSYTLLALERLLELRPAIAKVTNVLTTIDDLRNSDYNDIEKYVKFMKPFADATYSIEGQMYTTISEVIPNLLEIKNHLTEMKDVNSFKTASETMEKALSDRFDNILDPSHAGYQSVYTVATALDPRFSLVLQDSQIASAKAKISTMLGCYNEVSAVTPRELNDDQSTSQLAKLKFISSLTKTKHQQQQICKETTSAALQEVQMYFSDLPYEPNSRSDPVDDFWPKNASKFPLLSSLAMDILVIPATSAPVERVFSQASIALGSRRVRLSGENLEREVMLKCNRCFLR